MRNPSRFEADHLPGWRLAGIALVIIAVSALAVLWSAFLDGGGARQLGPTPPAGAAQALSHEPFAPKGETTDLAAQRAQLNHFSWVDRTHGVIAIPIDAAMELSLRRHP